MGGVGGDLLGRLCLGFGDFVEEGGGWHCPAFSVRDF